MALQVALRTLPANFKYETLGSESGIFLSHTVEKGFQFVKLSWLQQLVRKIFSCLGCYSSTHLKVVATQLVKAPDVDQALLAKMKASWEKTYPKLGFPALQVPPNQQPVEQRQQVQQPPQVDQHEQIAIQRPLEDQQVPEVNPEEVALDPPQADNTFDEVVEVAPPAENGEIVEEGVPLVNRRKAKPVRSFEVELRGATLALVGGNILERPVDAIVNAANNNLRRGGGVCGAIFKAAGGEDLQKECNEALLANGKSFQVGETVRTSSGKLPAPIQHIFHTVGPRETPGQSEEAFKELLALAVKSTLDKAVEWKVETLAIPIISGGIFGGNPEVCARQIWSSMQDYAIAHPWKFKRIELVTLAYEKMLPAIQGVLSGEAVVQHWVED